jgi:hypothetical protein
LLNQKPSVIGDGEYLTISNEEFTKAVYIGNVITNAQAVVAKAIRIGEFIETDLDVSLDSIDENTI